MSVRIKDLLLHTKTDISGKWISAEDAEKLAEAVVVECARIAELKEQGYSDFDPATSVGWYIRQYFGVK